MPFPVGAAAYKIGIGKRPNNSIFFEVSKTVTKDYGIRDFAFSNRQTSKPAPVIINIFDDSGDIINKDIRIVDYIGESNFRKDFKIIMW